MRKSLLVVLSLPLAAVVSSFAACTSDDNAAPGNPDSGLDFDSALPIPGFDGAPAGDSTLPPSDAGADAEHVDTGSVIPTDAGLDASTFDATVTDSGTFDAGADAGRPDAAYTDALAPSSWAMFNLASLDAGLSTLEGVTYDGRYAYFAPYASAGRDGIVARLDTTQDFAAAGAWTTYATRTVIPGTGGFAGAAYDGQYVYFVPFNNAISTATNGYDQTFVRYDTHADFQTGTSWTGFDGTDVATGPFVGATFDGRYVYYAPHFSSYVVWYDTHGTFNSDGAWTGFDTGTLTPPAPSSGNVFGSAIFDGTYVYFVGPVVARHDTTALPDAGASAWESFNAGTLADAGTQTYQVGAFDGRYLYLAAAFGADIIARYDTTLPFTAASSWTTFDVASVGGGAGGYFAMNFDGRTLYLVPEGSVVAMYDTQAPFTTGTSWATFDTSTLATVPEGYETTFFDGQYLYVASATGGPLLRLEVKTEPGPLPGLPLWRGSFF